MAITLQVYQSTLEITCGEPVIEGGIRANEVIFTFSPDDETWDGMARVAVFETRVDKRAVLLEDGRSCTIPWEVLADGSAGSYLRIGLYGTEEDSDGVIVRSTIWADNPYRVLPGPDADPGKDPTPDQYQQMLGLTSKVASRLDDLDQVETDVKASEQRAAASETAAANSAAAARNSASAAQTSATAAASAKTGAEQAEAEAEQAENAAAISAHNAQVWAEGGTLQDADGGDDPDGPRDGAKQLAEKAEEAKELAVQAAASAAGAQANAAQAAQEASTRANQAQQSASAADSSRIAAETAAGSAKTSESNAKASETAAKASETSAAASEEAAKTSETNAKASETAAEESAAEAEAAQEAAERARAAVENMQVQAQTLEPGTDATVTKTVENGVVKLLYGIPEGKQGPQGPPGSAVTATGLWGVDVDENGNLILTYVGDDVPPLSINEDGDLIYTLDGNEVNLGHVVGGDGGVGTTDYNILLNKPSINGIPLQGNLTTEELGIRDGQDGAPGADGATGPEGPPGQAATVEIVETETVSSDTPAAMVELPESTPQARRYKAQVPQGIQGPAGIGLPALSGPEDAGKVPVANKDGTGWLLGEAGSGREWRYLGTFTLPENTQVFEVSEDENGEPFEFSGEFVISAYIGAFFKNYTNNSSFVRLTDADGKKYDVNIVSIASVTGQTAGDIDSVTPVFSRSVYRGDVKNGKLYMSSLSDMKSADSAYSLKPMYCSVGLDCASTEFNKIAVWRNHPDNKLFAGSTISISVR